MRFQFIAMAAVAALSFAGFDRVAAAAGGVRISGPVVHDNLAVYFIHGESAVGPIPLTLAEAIEKGDVKVNETGDVNELSIENSGDEAVFVQSGDIVKGGKQDRVITSSLVLKPRSGQVSLAAFCVEQGRWSSRGAESVHQFASAAEAVPSREAKIAMRAPRPITTSSLNDQRRLGGDEVSLRQADVWASVAKTQNKLSGGLDADVAATASVTSLQLSLENEKLKTLRARYVDALQGAGQSGADIIGYAFAINGKLNSADVYVSNGLFAKMWPKQLQSAATEAIGEKDGAAESAPGPEAVTAFLADAKQGAINPTAAKSVQVRDSAKALYFAAEPADGRWVHENYLAK